MTILIIVGIIVLLGIIFASMYNSLVKLRNNRENAFADIDVQLKQRHDLIPQLVDTVKGYAAHEKETLDRVIQARNGAVSARTIDEKIAAENQLSSALSGLKITLEAYPDLKANQNFLQLQEEIADVENKLAAVRRYFNSATKEYNNAVRVSGNAGAWEFVPPVPKEMSNLMPEQIFRISYLGFPIVSLPFYLDTSPRQNTNKICFCTRLIRIFVIRRTGVDPFGDILTIRGRSVALSVTHFRKIYDLQ